jgi:serine/threonine protein kinase
MKRSPPTAPAAPAQARIFTPVSPAALSRWNHMTGQPQRRVAARPGLASERLPASIPAAPAPPAPARYRLGRRLDDDRMNEVYEASCPGVRGRAVVQLLGRARAAGPQATAACQREVELVTRLRHPHIAWGLGQGTTPDGVREYVEGETLRSQLFRGERLSPHQAVSVVNAMASALAAAHQAGALHGELRPSKIFLIEATGYAPGFVKIIDFGLWRLVPNRRGPAARAETTRFTAPELVTGRKDVDARADQFALASILYRMLAGVDAFPGDDVAAVLRAVVKEAPAPLCRIAGCEPMVEAIIRRGLAKDPRERFDNVLQFAAAYEDAVASNLASVPRRTTGSHAPVPDVDAVVDRAVTPAPQTVEASPLVVSALAMKAPAASAVTLPRQRPAPAHTRSHRRPLLLLALLATCAGAGWWTDWQLPPELAPRSLQQTWSLVRAIAG